MPPFARAVGSIVKPGYGIEQSQGVFWGTNLSDRHRQKLFPGISVALNRRTVHCQECETLQIVDPQRRRIAVKKQAVALFRFAQLILDQLPRCDLILKLVVCRGKLRSPLPHSHFQFIVSLLQSLFGQLTLGDVSRKITGN